MTRIAVGVEPTISPWAGVGTAASTLTPVQLHDPRWIVLLLALLVGACGARTVPPPTVVRIVETVEVKVPILVERTAPPELLAPLQSPLPIFVAPSDPQASSALTVEGERVLRALIEDLLTRIAAWQAWAASPEPD